MALVDEGHTENNAAVAATSGERLDFATVDTILRGIMRRDLENRWLMQDFVGLLVALPALRSRNEQMQRLREARVDSMAQRLVAAGLLDRDRTEHALPQLRRQVITQVAFWLPSAILAAPDRDPAGELDAYARAALALFVAYATRTGRRNSKPYSAESAALCAPSRSWRRWITPHGLMRSEPRHSASCGYCPNGTFAPSS